MKLYAESFIYSICLPEMLNSVSCVYADQFAIIKHRVKIVCPQHTNMLKDMHASDAISQKKNCVSDALLNAAEQNVPMMLSDVSSTQK